MSKRDLKPSVTFLSKSALDLDLTLSNARARQDDTGYISFIAVGALCVELWSFYCSKRISVQMSDIKLTYFGQCEQIDRRECCEKLTNAN